MEALLRIIPLCNDYARHLLANSAQIFLDFLATTRFSESGFLISTKKVVTDMLAIDPSVTGPKPEVQWVALTDTTRQERFLTSGTGFFQAKSKPDIDILFVGESHDNRADIERSIEILKKRQVIDGASLIVLERGMRPRFNDFLDPFLESQRVLEEDYACSVQSEADVPRELLGWVADARARGRPIGQFGRDFLTATARNTAMAGILLVWLKRIDPTRNVKIVIFFGERHEIPGPGVTDKINDSMLRGSLAQLAVGILETQRSINVTVFRSNA